MNTKTNMTSIEHAAKRFKGQRIQDLDPAFVYAVAGVHAPNGVRAMAFQFTPEGHIEDILAITTGDDAKIDLGPDSVVIGWTVQADKAALALDYAVSEARKYGFTFDMVDGANSAAKKADVDFGKRGVLGYIEDWMQVRQPSLDFKNPASRPDLMDYFLGRMRIQKLLVSDIEKLAKAMPGKKGGLYVRV